MERAGYGRRPNASWHGLVGAPYRCVRPKVRGSTHRAGRPGRTGRRGGPARPRGSCRASCRRDRGRSLAAFPAWEAMRNRAESRCRGRRREVLETGPFIRARRALPRRPRTRCLVSQLLRHSSMSAEHHLFHSARRFGDAETTSVWLDFSEWMKSMKSMKSILKWLCRTLMSIGAVTILVVVLALVIGPKNDETEKAGQSSETKTPTSQPPSAALEPELKGDPSFQIFRESDSSFGNIRSRIAIEIVSPEANDDRSAIIAMMAAAIERHRQTWPDAIVVRLWPSSEVKFGTMRNSIIYAPDGCGWTGDDCNRGLWTDLGVWAGIRQSSIPSDLLDRGRPSSREREEAKEIICKQSLQCWGGGEASSRSLLQM